MQDSLAILSIFSGRFFLKRRAMWGWFRHAAIGAWKYKRGSHPVKPVHTRAEIDRVFECQPKKGDLVRGENGPALRYTTKPG